MYAINLLILLIFFSLSSEARVFNFGSETFAGYFAGSIGLSQLSDDAFADTSGEQTYFSEKVTYNYSGEVGISFNSPTLALNLGLEILSPQKIEDEGSSVGGTKYLDLESRVRATILKVEPKFILTSTNQYRSFVGVGLGYATLSLTNLYSLTADGTANYSLTDFSEKATATSYMASLSMGIEYNFSDTATIVLGGGYRYLQVDSWEYASSGTGFTGPYTKGEKLLKHNGQPVKTDLGGIYFNLGFKIYL